MIGQWFVCNLIILRKKVTLVVAKTRHAHLSLLSLQSIEIHDNYLLTTTIITIYNNIII